MARTFLAIGGLAALALAATSASAQYRQGRMPPQMDETQILAQGTAVQVPLVMLANPKQMVAKAKVLDKDGHSVGSVNNIMNGEAGRPGAVKIDIGGVMGVGKKIISLDARSFLFEQDRDVLIANMTQDEIKALPAANGT